MEKSQETSEKKDSETSKKLELKTLQNELPIHDKSKSNQTFTFKDWGMPEEEEIGKIKSTNPSMGKFITSVLSYMLKTLHGENFAELDSKKRKLIINQMFSGNILYMYMYLRYDQVDDRMAFNFECPFCKHELDEIIVSLNDLDVDCKHGEYQEYEVYKLEKNITLEKGSQQVDNVKLGITKWNIIENSGTIKDNREFEGMKAALLNGIIGVEGIETLINVDEIVNKLRKIDIEYIHTKISEHNGGPDIQIPLSCPSCNKKTFRQIDWGYESFFGVSSLPRR